MGPRGREVRDSETLTLLREGFGVEDIALKLDCSVGRVRRAVEALRRAGAFENWKAWK